MPDFRRSKTIRYGLFIIVGWSLQLCPVLMMSFFILSRAKLYNRKRYSEKIEMKKKIKMHEVKETKQKKEDVVPKGAVPAYLLDR